MELSYINVCEPLLLRPLELPCSFPDPFINNPFDSEAPLQSIPQTFNFHFFRSQFLFILMKKL